MYTANTSRSHSAASVIRIVFFGQESSRLYGRQLSRNLGLLRSHHGKRAFESDQCVISVFPCFTCHVLTLVVFQVQSHFIPGFTFCIPFGVPDYLYAFWIPILAFESLLCGMALFRGFQAFRYRQSVFQSGQHLVTLLLRDSIVYFLM
jgi:hypothetical protein